MTTFSKFQPFVGKLGTASINFSTDVFKAALCLTAPVNTNAVFADISEIAAANGYVAGGATLTVISWNQVAGVAKWVVADQSYTATGGAIADFRYLVLYDNTATGKPLIGYYDYGATVSVTSGSSFIADFDGTNGIFQIT